jgi:glycosyltransferase 2 family protein
MAEVRRAVVRKQIWLGVRLLVSIALLAWLLLGFNWKETWQAMLKLSIGWILLLLLGLMINRLLAYFRFYVLLRSEGVEMPWWTVLRVSFLSTFAGNFLPTTVGGDVAKIGWFASAGHSTWRAALWALIDRLSNMLAIGLLAPFCLLLPLIQNYSRRWLGGWAPDFPSVLLLFLGFLLAAGIFLWLMPGRRDVVPSAGPEAASGRLGKIREMWTKVLSRKRAFGLLTLISLASILPNLLVTWLAAVNLDIPANFWQVAAIYVVLYFVTLLPISLNGLGVQEVSTVALYASLGATASQAAALAILLRFAIWITTLPGVFALGSLGDLRKSGSAGLAPGSAPGKIPESK